MDKDVIEALEAIRNERVYITSLGVHEGTYVPIVFGLKVVLHNYLITRGMSYIAAGKLLGKSGSQMTRLVSFNHRSNVDELETALQTLGADLGYSLEVSYDEMAYTINVGSKEVPAGDIYE